MFWTYLIAALQSVAPGTGATARSLLEAGRQPLETVLTALLNDLGAEPGELHLVLDDFHLVDAPTSASGWRSCSTTCHRKST